MPEPKKWRKAGGNPRNRPCGEQIRPCGKSVTRCESCASKKMPSGELYASSSSWRKKSFKPLPKRSAASSVRVEKRWNKGGIRLGINVGRVSLFVPKKMPNGKLDASNFGKVPSKHTPFKLGSPSW